jgi:hypothetical protein
MQGGCYMDNNTNVDGKATFTIQILFQQNNTWQGTISWLEGEKKQKFRSELELIKLMMEATGFTEESKSW